MSGRTSYVPGTPFWVDMGVRTRPSRRSSTGHSSVGRWTSIRDPKRADMTRPPFEARAWWGLDETRRDDARAFGSGSAGSRLGMAVVPEGAV